MTSRSGRSDRFDDWGPTALRADLDVLAQHFGIDVDTIVGAAFDLLGADDR
jgi:hypothetical protein